MELCNIFVSIHRGQTHILHPEADVSCGEATAGQTVHRTVCLDRPFESVLPHHKKTAIRKDSGFFVVGEDGFERPVQANSPVDCLPGRGFSAEKRIRGNKAIV